MADKVTLYNLPGTHTTTYKSRSSSSGDQS